MNLRTLLTIFVALCGLVATAAARPDLNAFLNRKVVSMSGLVYQVKTDGEVRDRYERHFTMDQAELIGYLSKLHVMHLKAAYRTNVYSVPEGGFIKVHQQTFKKGALVFADPNNHPILLVKCGNPLTLGPHMVSAVVSPPALSGSSATALRPIGSPGGTGADSLPADALALEPSITTGDAGTKPETGVSVTDTPTPTTPTEPANPAQVPPTRPQGFSFGNPNPDGLLAGLGGLAGVFTILSHSSGGGHNIVPAVPEPPMLLLLVPMAGAMLLRRKRV